MTSSRTTDKAQEIRQQRDDSRNWMREAYWPQWEEVFKNYHCHVDPRTDEDGNEDEEATAIGMPDTFSMVSRRTARITAQIPNIGFIADQRNEEIEKSVSRKISWDWDNGRVQRWQKKHVRQAELFGWSVRSWHWDVSEFMRRRAIDITKQLSPVDLEQVAKTYQVDPTFLDPQSPAYMPTLTRLLQAAGRRGLLDVQYLYKAYEGPRSEVLFVGDCYPEPFFDSIQTSNRFIVEQRRNREWLTRLAKRFPDQFAAGVQELFDKHPKGSPNHGNGRSGDDGYHLRDQLRHIIGLPTSSHGYNQASTGSEMWNIMARWVPGERPKLAYVAEDEIFLGEMDSPYILDGKIPFTEMILIDSVLGGVGDSVARMVRGLQAMHNLQTNRRFDLFRHVSQPMLGTSDRRLFDNPKMITRSLMRLIHLSGGPGSIWPINDQNAVAALMAATNEEGPIMRMLQMASGDSNMSMAANVDPAQVRTATGAKMLQANADVLTKDLVDMFHMTSVCEDVEMCYLLNRSEMADAVNIDAAKYDRNYTPESDRRREEWISSEPMHFQVDGKLTVELGSTMADDDEANVVKATNLFQMLSGNPLVNQESLTRDLLVAFGKGPKLAEYMQAPQPGPPPIKASLSVSFDAETMPEAEKRAVLASAGITPEMIQQMDQQVQQELAAAAQPPALPEPGMEPPMDPGMEPPMGGEEMMP